MQNTTRGVDVLTTQVAWNDRRALSQAWYSALHLTEREPAHAPTRAPRPYAAHPSRAPQTTDVERAPERSPRGTAAPAHAMTTAPGRRDGTGSRHAGAADTRAQSQRGERRHATPPLAQRIARKLSAAPARGDASFTVRSADRRVHVVVRASAGRTRIVAVCAPDVRSRVERALAHARFALAARGVRAEAA